MRKQEIRTKARQRRPAAVEPKPAAPEASLPELTATAKRKAIAGAPGRISKEERAALIARAAYFRAERRGFTPGRELEDWYAAEAEVDAMLRR